MNTKANGISFNCRIDGPDGAPWLMLSNSLATNLSMWDRQTAVLSEHYRMLRYAPRGHGGTGQVETLGEHAVSLGGRRQAGVAVSITGTADVTPAASAALVLNQ